MSRSVTHFVTTRARADRCPRCGRLRLTGLSEGLPFRVDPAPLTVRAELTARMAGRWSYWLTAGTVAYRTPEKIAADAIRGRPIVFADHDCSAPPGVTDIDPTFLPALGRLFARMSGAPDFSDIELDAFRVLAVRLGARVIGSDVPPF